MAANHPVQPQQECRKGFTKRVVLPRRTDANHGDAETRSVVLGQFLEESGDSAEERAKDLRPSR